MGGSPKGGTGKGVPTGGISGFRGKTVEPVILVRCTDTLTVEVLSVDFGFVDRPLVINPDSVTAMSGRKEKRTMYASVTILCMGVSVLKSRFKKL